MRRMQQDVRRLLPALATPSVPVAEGAASISAASTKKAAVSALVDADLTTINPVLEEKLRQLNDRIEALEPPI
ncbi:hypothetical protein HZY97_16295 [Sphingomonas sp. R-74633]|uniref:hypothetical protein n=1 Tax=Sphingomonas sp. R-74633 TaxID=2751188 RepID=UPI0015D42F7D|nr:hypothetical protein [Sphingomonas sp. R-74633]NYT42334.1 hypothetical protein [Sphingomonas sp. R-74633]